MSFVNFENRAKFMWNVAFRYVMNIKDEYIAKFGTFDTFSIKEMCERLNTPEYNNFLLCVDVKNLDSLNIIKYSLIKGGDIDINDNPNSIYREMRGVVINMETEELVLVPFRKFFNIDQIEEFSWDVFSKQLRNAKSVEITNKMDGSMVSCRYYNNQFMMGGTGSILGGGNFRLEEAQSWLIDNYKKMIKDYPEITFIFEYISLKDKHVVVYTGKDQGLYLIGARNIFTGEEWSYNKIKEVADNYRVTMTEIEKVPFNEIQAKAKKESSSVKEGWVIYIDGIKYKFKCDDYVKVAEILDKLASKNILIRAIVDGTVDDIISKVPTAYRQEILNDITFINKYVKDKMEEIYFYYNQVKDIEDDKDFAMACKKLKLSKQMMGRMFALRKGYEINILQSSNGRYVKGYEIFGK